MAPFELLATLERLTQAQLEQRSVAAAAVAADAEAVSADAAADAVAVVVEGADGGVNAGASEAQRILASAQRR